MEDSSACGRQCCLEFTVALPESPMMKSKVPVGIPANAEPTVAVRVSAVPAAWLAGFVYIVVKESVVAVASLVTFIVSLAESLRE